MIERTLFNADHESLRDSFRRFVDKEIAPFHEAWEEQGYVDRAVWNKAGANGFIMKDATVQDLVSTIRSVALGADVVPPALTGTLLSHIAQQAAAIRQVPGAADAVRMTKREKEIMNLIAEGLSNKEIAQQLNIATYTVKSHVHNILEKLALHSRLQIAAYTHRAGPLSAAT